MNCIHAVAYVNRGLTKKKKGDAEGALADYNRGIELDPKNAVAYFDRAVLKDKHGDRDGAVADYDRAIEFDPQEPLAYEGRGRVYLWGGK